MEAINPPTQTSASPFVIRHEDLIMTCASRGFQILRSYLATTQENVFCDEHECSPEARDEWILHRDIIHALVVPVVQLFNRASNLAQAALCSDKPDDWELAFRNEARGAFQGLECFLADENDWCNTRGCPACVSTTALATESHIRFIIAAVLLGESTGTPANSPSSVTLPPLSFFLSSVRSAILVDPLWGEPYSEHLYVRAEQLSDGLKSLVEQCGELEVLVASPGSSPVRSPVRTDFSNVLKDDDTIKVCPSRLAKRQARLRQEEQAYLHRLAHQCWGAVALPREVRMMMKSGVTMTRTRSQTCP